MHVKNLITNKIFLDQMESQQKRLQDLAMKHPLTGLFSRNCLSKMAPKLISEARRHGLAVKNLSRFPRTAVAVMWLIKQRNFGRKLRDQIFMIFERLQVCVFPVFPVLL
ncbi:MAG: hypothetical protein ACE5FY_03810 [Nitrospiria bacterium]